MGYSISTLQSRRGAGLGNEVLGWAKAYLGGRELGLRVVEPPWSINPRPYRKELNRGLINDLVYGAVRLSKPQEISLAMVRSAGSLDYVDVLRELVERGAIAEGRSVLHSSGMFGGYRSIAQAKTYLRSELIGTVDGRAAGEALDAGHPDLLRVAVHFRRGDFGSTPPAAGSFNGAVPLAWYSRVVQSLSAAIDLDIDLVLASDTASPEAADALAGPRVHVRSVGRSSVGDLSAMVNSDILIASVSSFSMLAAYLSDAPYVWYANQLTEVDGWRGIWSLEDGGAGRKATSAASSLLGATASMPRGIPQGSEPHWQTDILEYLRNRVALRNRNSDLIYYGAVQRG